MYHSDKSEKCTRLLSDLPDLINWDVSNAIQETRNKNVLKNLGDDFKKCISFYFPFN